MADKKKGSASQSKAVNLNDLNVERRTTDSQWLIIDFEIASS